MIEHPVLTALAELDALSATDLDFLRQHGRPYQGMALPYGIEPWPLGQCLDAADALEAEEWGAYCRGFALRPGSRAPLHHAWVSPGGFSALDAVWSEPEACSYFGIRGRKFENELQRMSLAVERAIVTRGRPSWFAGAFGSL